MNRELSTAEIDQLHRFCRQHYVTHYDVRVELVDHLASSIEAYWSVNPGIPFEKALDKVYSNYGPTGFRKLMREKEQAVEKAFHKGLARAFAAMFAWPNIVIAGALSLVCVFFGNFYEKGQAHIPAVFILFFCSFGFLLDIAVSVVLHRKKQQLREPLLVTNVYSGFFLIFLLEYSMCYRLTSYLIDRTTLTDVSFSRSAFLIYSAICIVCVLMSLAKYRFAQRIFEKARKTYPLAFR